jgi:hypothetical protein
MVNRRPTLELPLGRRRDRRVIAGSASPAQAAAIVAALEHFMRETAPPAASLPQGPDPWLRAAMLEGVGREVRGDVPDPWINP